MGALYGALSWWIAVGLLVSSALLKSLSRHFDAAAQKVIREGVVVGQLTLDENNRAWSRFTAAERV